MVTPTHFNPTDHRATVDLIETISPEDFNRWYYQREYRRNIEQGTPYFNGPSPPQPATRHSPSRLLKCHRQTYYQQHNAPEETEDPDGIFWIGSRFEEDIILPYLREAVAGEDEYVTNSMWIDFTVSTDTGDLRIKGETDPVIVSHDYEPILLTEIKTKDSVEHTSKPSRHHRAQAHAYMKGLSEKYDRNVSEAVILYASRETLDVKPFDITFDSSFWNRTVLDWAETNTTYRIRGELPPAAPEYDWECDFCSFSERCGTGDSAYADVAERGFLPGVAGYPREKVVEYLEAAEEARLTPTLAGEYPELVSDYEVCSWWCPECSSTFAWDALESESTTPACSVCADEGKLTELVVENPVESRSTDNQKCG
jgi:CRISPR/Cas system-associated exonuclease Cas4 (RecB family)